LGPGISRLFLPTCYGKAAMQEMQTGQDISEQTPPAEDPQERKAMRNSGTQSLSFTNIFTNIFTRWLVLVSFPFALSIGQPSFAADSSSLAAEAAIRQLTICYALGTDAIGAGDVKTGKALYRDCFTPDAPLAAVFPDGQGTERQGSDAWADYVNEIFRANAYTATQHLIGTINIRIDPATGTTATMTSYLHATHVRPNGSIDVANGTYTDEVIKTDTGWRIRKRTLRMIAVLNLAASSAK
jgi:hypothetical protein